MSGERNRLVTDPFHQITVGGDHVCMVIDEVVAVTDAAAEKMARRLAREDGLLDAVNPEFLGEGGARDPIRFRRE